MNAREQKTVYKLYDPKTINRPQSSMRAVGPQIDHDSIPSSLAKCKPESIPINVYFLLCKLMTQKKKFHHIYFQS